MRWLTRVLAGLLLGHALLSCREDAPVDDDGPAAGSGSGGASAGMAGSVSAAAGAASPAGGGGASSGSSVVAGTSNQGGAGSSNSGGEPAQAGTGGGPVAEQLMNAHFTAAELGAYARDEVAADFGAAPAWDDGLGEGRATIEAEADNRFLRVTFPADVFGPANGGVQFIVTLAESHEELFFAYRVRFQAGFGFNRGGKLPGLVGGTSPTGCQPEETGFSARNMWRMGGAIVQYVYWPDQPNTCGDDLDYEADGEPLSFTPGTWQTVEHRIKMNTPGQSDGVMQAWIDGQLYLDDSARQWRKVESFAIDALYFSTFFGGSTQDWASPMQQSVDFDDLIVSSVPIAH